MKMRFLSLYQSINAYFSSSTYISIVRLFIFILYFSPFPLSCNQTHNRKWNETQTKFIHLTIAQFNRPNKTAHNSTTKTTTNNNMYKCLSPYKWISLLAAMYIWLDSIYIKIFAQQLMDLFAYLQFHFCFIVDKKK